MLRKFGMDEERTNERSALTLLALLHMGPNDTWDKATNPMLGTRAIMDWIRDEHGKNYAANSRETIRRFTLHQFVEAGLVVMNPDQPDRPVNSPKSNYQITAEALEVLRLNNDAGPAFGRKLKEYQARLPGLKAQYAAARELNRIPTTLPDGSPFTLSPGGQNILIKQIVEEFCPQFTPGGEVLYVGDADAKWALHETDRLKDLGIRVDQHGKMPDLVVYMADKNWLILLEAASSHGPVDAKRHAELAKLFESSTAGLVYVSCFPDRKEMRKYLSAIAWETEVWCAEDPTHMVHFNGDKFLGPY